jgi:pimeloyl-ACP methyl ester carboxylesterase
VSLATALDSVLSSTSGVAPGWPPGTRQLDTRAGCIRVRDTGGKGPVIVMVPDGPNVIEHHGDVIDRLAPHARVVCFDMPGFGFSAPRARYDHSLAQGADVVLAVLDALDMREAALAFSCANGFYAIAAARQAPQRVRHLLLAQTPGFSAMPAWTQRNVPKAIQTPVVGQLLNRVVRRKLAHTWYGMAMPDKPERSAFRATADAALADGACFCLAGVVQGLSRATPGLLAGVTQPATLLWGDSDRSHKHTRAETLHELLPHAQIRHLPDCGHFPDLEQPRAYADVALAAIAA